MIETLLSCAVTGVISGGLTIAVLKTDMKWIKETLSRHDERIYNMERKI